MRPAYITEKRAKGWLMGGGKTKGRRTERDRARLGVRADGERASPVRKTNHPRAEWWMLLADAMQCGIKSRD